MTDTLALGLALFFWLLVIFAGFLIGSIPARSEEPAICGPRKELLDALLSRYHERPIAAQLLDSSSLGSTESGPRLLEVLMSADGSTGTILLTDTASGRSCLFIALSGVGNPA